MSWLIVIIVVTLRFLLESPRDFSGLTILLRCRFYHPIYLVRMAILFFGYRDWLPFWRDAFRFLRPAPEIIIQACSLINQGILVRRKALNSYNIFNIRSQSFIELGHFGAFILLDSG
jgi:hypothetical protein